MSHALRCINKVVLTCEENDLHEGRLKTKMLHNKKKSLFFLNFGTLSRDIKRTAQRTSKSVRVAGLQY